MRAAGWFLDVYIRDDRAVLWFKIKNGRTLRLTDRYRPDFYVEPKSEERTQPQELIDVLRCHPHITDVAAEQKFTRLDARKKSSVLHIWVDSTGSLPSVLRDTERLGTIKAYYNTDILHVQRYLFKKGLAPTRKVEVDYNEGEELLKLKTLDDSAEIQPPPFTWAVFSVEINTNSLSPDVRRDPISRITIQKRETAQNETFEGDETKILQKFTRWIEEEDPDFLVAPQVEAVLRYILERARIQGLNLQIGREETSILELNRLSPCSHKGRVHLNLRVFSGTGIAGLVERCRFAMTPIGLSAKWAPGRIIDSRQCFEALRRGFLLPNTGRGLKHVTTAKDVVFKDKGGLILSPKVGLHEGVGELDYESMFPHIIVKHNISYETVTPYYVDRSKSGFLGELTWKFLQRRLHFKQLRKKLPTDCEERAWCDQRQKALKLVLVCIYGYSGCFANRFSNVATYEEINRVARETLVRTINIAMGEGFEVIYADSDSIFVKRKRAERTDYECLAQKISEETGLPISLDCHYKYLVFLHQETNPDQEATRRYFGKLMNGSLNYRGIELRRHDSPPFIKEFERKLLTILFDADCAEKVKKEQVKKAYNHVVETCNKVIQGKVSANSLIISKTLKKPVIEYKSILPHVAAAIQMRQKGKKMQSGQNIEYLYINTSQKNPLRRVVSASISDRVHYYDREKYVELVLNAAETILGIFNFEKKQLGLKFKPCDFASARNTLFKQT